MSIGLIKNRTCRFEYGQIGFCGHIYYRLVAEVRLLSYPKILYVCGCYRSILYAYGFGSAFCAFYLGLRVQLFSFEIGACFLDFYLAVLLGFGEFGLSGHFLLPYIVPGHHEKHGHYKYGDTYYCDYCFFYYPLRELRLILCVHAVSDCSSISYESAKICNSLHTPNM